MQTPESYVHTHCKMCWKYTSFCFYKFQGKVSFPNRNQSSSSRMYFHHIDLQCCLWCFFWYSLLNICQVILNALNNFLTDSKMTWPVVSVEAPCLLLASSLHSAIQVTILIKLQTFKNSVALFVTKSSSNFSATEEAQL